MIFSRRTNVWAIVLGILVLVLLGWAIFEWVDVDEPAAVSSISGIVVHHQNTFADRTTVLREVQPV